MRVLISAERIHERIKEMSAAIAADYGSEPVTLVGVLSGCIIFLADLVRQLSMPTRIEFLRASSYPGTATTPSKLEIIKGFSPEVRGRNVLLIDDILDSGQTLSQLAQHLRELGAKSVRIAVLLRKPARQVVPLEPDYCGFEIPDLFVVGYGLDFNNDYRQLPYIAVLDEHQTSVS